MTTEGAISGRRVGTLLAARLIGPIVTLLVYGLVSRRGGPGALGIFYYATTFVGIFQTLANFGYDSFLMREVAKTPERARALLTNSLALLTPYGLALALAMPLLVRALGYQREVVDPLWIGALALPLMALAYALEAVLIGQERFGAMLAGSALDGILRLALSLVALATGRGASGLLLALAIARGASVLFYLASLSRRPGFFPPELHPSVLFELLRGAGPFFLMYISYAVATKLDGALLARFATKADGDAYGIPNRLTLAVWLVSGSVVGTLYPAMARAAGTPALGVIVTRCLRLFLLVSLPAAAILSSYPEPVLLLLAGKVNAPLAARVLTPMVWAIVPLTCNEPALRGLLAAGGQRASVGNSIAVLVTAAVMLTWGIKTEGAYGAACALPFVILTDLVLNLVALSRRTDLAGVPRALAPIALAGAGATALLRWLAPSVGYAGILVFVAFYLILLLGSRALSFEELRHPRRMLSA